MIFWAKHERFRRDEKDWLTPKHPEGPYGPMTITATPFFFRG